ncbi:hypothetical protein VNO78_25487 [Psophocarpus tetragonolobus]|uniref:Uncharacterized protein n=1 Tax=Psophocarpus tetragonolobus TaxID=3891 RepID=A0AAN9S6I9_PSOTE
MYVKTTRKDFERRKSIANNWKHILEGIFWLLCRMDITSGFGLSCRCLVINLSPMIRGEEAQPQTIHALLCVLS